jgi:hypothetical protein
VIRDREVERRLATRDQRGIRFIRRIFPQQSRQPDHRLAGNLFRQVRFLRVPGLLGVCRIHFLDRAHISLGVTGRTGDQRGGRNANQSEDQIQGERFHHEE